MALLKTLVFLGSIFVIVTGCTASNPEWAWTCVLDTIDGPSCVRQVYNSSDQVTKRVSPGACFLTCGPHGALWPYPSGTTHIGSTLLSTHPDMVTLASVDAPTAEVQVLLQEAMTLTQGHIRKIYELGLEETSPNQVPVKYMNAAAVQVHLKVTSTETKIRIGTNEAYTLQISSANGIVSVHIEGTTFFGVRHGLETLTQLMAFNEFSGLLEIVSECGIEDSPKFMYRGVLIDTGRNFIPIPALKRMVDAMAYNKLNMMHWHLSDSNSFPFESKRVPLVTAYGTYSPKKVYTAAQVSEFIKYANLRGVKVIPELDAPSHAGNGWNWGPLEGLGDLALCVNAEPYRDYCIQPPCGQLNPLNSNTYDVLGSLYADLLDVFDRDVFHMGNDEISFKCWEKSEEIREWLEQHNTTDMMELWGVFQNEALLRLKSANQETPVTPFVWTSDMTLNGRRFLSPEEYVIQIWSETTLNDTSMRDILNENYRVIFSNKDHVYLDHGYGPWRDNGYPPHDPVKMTYWQNYYGYDIMALVTKLVGATKAEELFNAGKIFGGEAALWSEKVDEYNMEMKMWPRSAAFAERVWSNPGPELPRFAYPRLINHRLRMIQRGTRVDTLLPESCHYINGFCD